MASFTGGVKQGFPWIMLFADNTAIYSEGMQQVEESLERFLNLFASDPPNNVSIFVICA